MVSLKTKNIPIIVLYIIVNLSILIALCKVEKVNELNFTYIFSKIKYFLEEKYIIYLIGLLLVFIFSGILPAKWKEMIVFWKIKNRLPGCYAFSKYAKEDNRIDLKLLESNYGVLPTDPREQNELWYKIYKNLNDSEINDSHKNFLLAREITVISFIGLILIFPFLFLNYICVFMFLFLLIEFIIFRIIAKNYAERFVTNVLAYESSRLYKEKKAQK